MNHEQKQPDNFDPDDHQAVDRDRQEDALSQQLSQQFTQQFFDSLEPIQTPDDQFVDRLCRQLDEEYEAVMATSEPSGRNGFGHDSDASVDRRVLRSSLYSDSENGRPDDSSPRSRMISRWFGGFVAAAVLLGLFSFWTVQPITSWAEMLEALKSAPWVQTDSGRTSSWISASNQIMARRDANQTWFASGDSGMRMNYVRDEATIYQTEAEDSWRPLDDQLFAWLANSAGGVVDSSADWQIVWESASRVDDERGRWLKLTLVFESTDSKAQTFTAVFTIDPETRMPVSCQVREGTFRVEDSMDAATWQSVSFDYPSGGPTNIFDLGVAAGTPIVLAGMDSKAGLVSTNVPSDSNEVVANQLAMIEPEVAPDLFVKPDQAPEKKPETSESEKTDPGSAGKEGANNESTLIAAKEREPVSFEPEPLAAATTVPIVPIPSSSMAMTSRVDRLLEDLWQEKEIEPVDLADDETFLRRVYLDVIGRVPTVGEYNQFFNLDQENRRSELIDQLLDSREHALHMGGIWKRVLVPDDETAISRLGGSGKLEQWLSDAFAENLPYDELVRRLLLAEGRVNESGPLLFYAAAKMNAEELAARTSRTFLGMRMECAECHDHPFDHWSQKDFWGLAAYFAQISRPQGKIEMVSPVLRVRDADFGSVKLPETETVVEPKLPVSLHGGHGMTQADIDELKEAEVTGGSRREQLASWITHPKNSHFAQATVNRIWGHLFGQGLVDPVDDMGGHNIPDSPQLLNQLGRYFVQSDFDVRELMRVLINSQAYQLSSKNNQESNSKDVRYFARVPLKPLTAEQLYDCLATATGRADLGSHFNRPMNLAIASNVDRFSDPGRAAFLAQFRTSIDQRTDYQAGIPQALILMNGPMIASATTDAPKGVLRSLSAPFFDDSTRIETLFVATLSRKPTDDEKSRYAEFLRGQADNTGKSETLGDVLWVLINSVEFTMNH